MSEPYPQFENEREFKRHFQRVLAPEVAAQNVTCLHEYDETGTFDENGTERVCIFCGAVAPTEITEFDKLSGCLDGEDFLKVRYGPATPPPLQSFLLPTLLSAKEKKRIKVRDKFIDKEHLSKTRKYTDIQRICQQFGIPNDYAIETMRRLLRSGKNIHSAYKPIDILIELISEHPQLSNRVTLLKRMTKDGQKLERYRSEIEQLKKELKKERKKADSDWIKV